MKKGATLLAAVAASLGVGATKAIYNHRDFLKQQAKKAQKNATILKKSFNAQSFLLRHAYQDLPNVNQASVDHVLALIVPDNAQDKKFKTHADEYLKVLKYAQVRYDINAKDIKHMLNDSTHRTSRILRAMIDQNLLEYNGLNEDVVLQNNITRQLDIIRPFFLHQNTLVNKRFSKAMKNIIAKELYY